MLHEAKLDVVALIGGEAKIPNAAVERGLVNDPETKSNHSSIGG